jgi:hypothetical protein
LSNFENEVSFRHFFSQILEKVCTNFVLQCQAEQCHSATVHHEVKIVFLVDVPGVAAPRRRSERSIRQQPQELRRLQSRHQRLPAQDPGGPPQPHAHRNSRTQPEAYRAFPGPNVIKHSMAAIYDCS